MENQETKTGRKFYKQWWFWIVAVIAILIVRSSFRYEAASPISVPVVPAQQQEQSPAPTTPTASAPATPSRADAQAQLDDLMALARKARLITTYEFSDSQSVVYADSIWYTQTVQFKKDFIAKIATLKEAATGYRHFEVDDAYSGKKLAEVTAFSGALEVYK